MGVALFSKVMSYVTSPGGDIARDVEVREAVIPHPATEETIESREVQPDPERSVNARGGHHRRVHATLCGRPITGDRPLIMAIVNRTPDSFYDRGATFTDEAAKAAAHRVIEDGADVVILGGAGLAGLAAKLKTMVDAPLLDGVACAISMAEALAHQKLAKAGSGALALPAPVDSVGLSKALAKLLGSP